MLKDYKLNKVEISDHQFNPQVEKCITTEVFNLLAAQVAGKFEKGLIPIEIAFVLTITPKFEIKTHKTGYVYGEDLGEQHCFHFSAPTGWVMDNQSGKQYSLPLVLYPKGSSFQKASTSSFMYAKAAVKSKVGNTIHDLVNTNVNLFKTKYNETNASAKLIKEALINSQTGKRIKVKDVK